MNRTDDMSRLRSKVGDVVFSETDTKAFRMMEE